MDPVQIYKNAREAQYNWERRSVEERLKPLTRFRRLIADQAADLARKIRQATGKPTFEAITAEVLTVADTISYWEKRAKRLLRPQTVPTPWLLFGRRSWIEYAARGVVLVIAPWNYPFQLSLIPTLAAILAGNAVVVKPSEVTSSLDSLLAELFLDAGFPSGLVQVISGDGSVGVALVENRPDFIFFTGSVTTGKTIQKAAATHLIPTVLELGGKDAAIILEDAPLQRAISGSLWGSFTNWGQVCLATERILVHNSLYEEFVERFVKEAKALPASGLTSEHQVEVVARQVEDALRKGAKLLTGVPPEKWETESLVLKPMVLVDVTDTMDLAQQESFGPVVSITPFATEEEAVRLANGVRYGLGASVWSQNLTRARELAEKLEVGNVSINDSMITVANPHLPFGGTKASGLGAYHGAEGLRVFCIPKAVMASSGKRTFELNWYPYHRSKEELVLQVLKTRYGSGGGWWSLVRKALGWSWWNFVENRKKGKGL